VNADGHIGIVTMAALNRADPKWVIKNFSDRRTAYYRSLKLFWKYGKGWLHRTVTIEHQATAIA
jgi:lysozyme family protein